MVVGLWMIIGAIFGVLCGFAAIPRNRSAVPWWFAGVTLGPFGLLWLRLAGRRDGPKALL